MDERAQIAAMTKLLKHPCVVWARRVDSEGRVTSSVTLNKQPQELIENKLWFVHANRDDKCLRTISGSLKDVDAMIEALDALYTAMSAVAS